jgi:hypothetical protein
MREALEARGPRTKRAVVEAGLRNLIDLHRQGRIRSLRGKFNWTGDLGQV